MRVFNRVAQFAKTASSSSGISLNLRESSLSSLNTATISAVLTLPNSEKSEGAGSGENGG
jgi:hypothetical protein